MSDTAGERVIYCMEWQAISTAPKNGEFLIYTPEREGGFHVHSCKAREKFWTAGGRFLFDFKSKPTHWMPLPPAPAVLPDHLDNSQTPMKQDV